MKFALLTLSALALAGCAIRRDLQPKRSAALFAHLTAADRVHVRYTSSGCGGIVTYDFDFRHDSATSVRIASVERTWDAQNKRIREHAPKPLGSIILTSSEINGLDKLLQFYRTHPDGFCTTSVDVTIAHYRAPGADPIATEHYVDASCETIDMKGITRFPDIAGRLKPKPE